MKNYSAYILIIIFLIFLSICGFYNYFHPIIDSNEKQIYKGKIVEINTEYEYDENSEYIKKYNISVKTNKDEVINVNIKKDELKKYPKNSYVNIVENKGEYVITDEKPNTSRNVIWLIISIIEILVILILIIKIIKSR